MPLATKKNYTGFKHRGRSMAMDNLRIIKTAPDYMIYLIENPYSMETAIRNAFPPKDLA